MTDDAPRTEAHDDAAHRRMVRLYLTVFVALAVFTLASFLANYFASGEHPWISKGASFLIVLGVAVVKAALVGYVFMHLMADWRKLYFMIFPAFILGFMMMMVLMPDIVLAWQH
jgi:cytochrome c oxidase subunit IV